MATTQTSPESKTEPGSEEQAQAPAVKTNEPTQSVFVKDMGIVKNYPISHSNDQIDYDLHTTVRGQTPEDYFVNFLPNKALQMGIRALSQGPTLTIAEAGKEYGPRVIEALDTFGKNELDPAMKLIAIRPDVALGFPQGPVSPEELALTYKPWLDIWKESEVGSTVIKAGFTEEALAYAPAPIAAIPWFITEFMPEQLLEFGTRAQNWVAAKGLDYGIEKFGPPIINGILAKMPASAREFLLKDLFAAEKSLVPDFETLGINLNAKTSDVIDAYRKAARVTHPDLGGNPEEFVKVSQAYENIMKSRSTWYDKLFDAFRGQQEETAAQAPKGLLEKLKSEKGSMLIPGKGDLVKIGKEFGQVLDVVGQMATVNIAGKATQIALDKLQVVPKKASAVNPENMAIGQAGEEKLKEATTLLGKELENQGKPLTHEEVIAKSQEADILTHGVSREATLEFQAALLKTRKHLAALAEDNELTPEFLDSMRVLANVGTDIARNLESFKIEALPEHAAMKMKIIKELQKLGKTSEEILKAAKGVDFKDEQSVAKFYRQFVKPTLPELLDEYVYMNILSSPLTHIKNTFSNVLQLAGLNPLTKLASGSIDFVASNLTGAERKHYVSEIPDFYKGAINAVPKAIDGALQAMKGKKLLERPDVKRLPTLSKLVDFGTLGVGKYVTRALEASDVFFRTMIQAGEKEALSKSIGHTPDAKEAAAIQKESEKRADYYVFRKKPDAENKTGQGKLLSAIDQMTNAVYRFRAVPGMKWFVRFVQTPMNILKQGVEYSPAGFATMPGAKDKAEQAGKAIIGSMVFAGASWLAANNLTTWAAPTGKKEKNEFYAAGLQPYSFKFGDKWVSYSQIGPLAYPIAMAAALHYYTKESPDALSDTEMDKVVSAMTGIMRFFSDQSYMQGLGDLISFARGERSKAVSSAPTQLVPLSSLQGWINNIIDPLQRKAESNLSIDAVIQQIEMKIVGMSQLVPQQVDMEETPVKKQLRGVNAVSPMKVSQVDEEKTGEYRESQKTKQEINQMKKEFS